MFGSTKDVRKLCAALCPSLEQHNEWNLRLDLGQGSSPVAGSPLEGSAGEMRFARYGHRHCSGYYLQLASVQQAGQLSCIGLPW